MYFALEYSIRTAIQTASELVISLKLYSPRIVHAQQTEGPHGRYGLDN